MPLQVLLSFLGGGVLVATIECVALAASGASTLASVFALILGYALIIGIGASLATRIVMAWRSAWLRAIGYGIATLPVWVLVAHRLFDGGTAQTLAGADTAWLWLPIALGIVTIVTFRLAIVCNQRLPWFDKAATVTLLVALAALEWANRALFVSEYANVHAALSLASIIVCSLALYASGLLGRWRAATLKRWCLVGGAICAVLLAATLMRGFASKASRVYIASYGVHARQLARITKTALDFDGDNYASVLGGGDCDDGDPKRNPTALDIPGNGIDEDCDGLDADKPAPPSPALATYAEAAQNFRTPQRLARFADYHIIFVVVDALRADTFAPTPANRSRFPNLHALVAQSRYFERAFSPASATDISMATLLTGRHHPFVPIQTTLWEAMRASGRQVHGVVPREVMRWAGGPLLSRGLTSKDIAVTDAGKRDIGRHASSAKTTRLGMRFLTDSCRNQADRCVLWLHYFDVHEHHTLDVTDDALARALAGNRSPTPPEKYRATTKLVDQAIGQLTAELKALALWDRSVVVLVADHGESLGEHRRLPQTHGRFLYAPLIHIPLAIRAPQLPPARIPQPVALVDLTPTLVELSGASALPTDGVSLLPLLFDDSPPVLRAYERLIPLYESDQWGLIWWPHKLLVRPRDNLVELYDLASDFDETTDLADSHPKDVSRLKQAFYQFPQFTVERTRAAMRARDRIARQRPSGN